MLSRSNHYLGRVHRRIGGLEIPLGQIDVKASVHRRIGGLENEKHDQRMVNMTKIERIEHERELILKTHAQMLERGMIEVKKC